MKNEQKKLYQVNFIAIGKVQGVCFRYFVQLESRKENVTGWVKNMPSNNVEGVIQGRCNNLKKVLGIIKKGPPMAKVIDFHENWEPVSVIYKSFDIRY